MTDGLKLLEFHDVHLLDEELADPASRARLRRLGMALEPHPALERARVRLEQTIDGRWLRLYERARGRYGRGVSPVRGRVCRGCHITLPTALSPGVLGSLTVCESCGRVLYWA